MSAYIKTLKNVDGDFIYPQTKASAVYTNDGENIEKFFYEADNTPIAGSENVVRSGGIADALANKAEKNHAGTHAIGGSDQLFPEQIGAATANHTHTPSSIGAATATTLTATIPNTGWVASGNFYYLQVSIAGMLATDNPVADILPGSDNDANKLYADSWGKVQSIDMMDGAVKLWATAVPGAACPVQFKITRDGTETGQGKCILAGHGGNSGGDSELQLVLQINLSNAVDGDTWTLPKPLFDYSEIYSYSTAYCANSGYSPNFKAGDSNYSIATNSTSPRKLMELRKAGNELIWQEYTDNSFGGILQLPPAAANSNIVRLAASGGGNVNGTVKIYAR